MNNKPENTIATLTINYESGQGSITQRGVSVTEFDPYELFGLCHLRDRYRTFLCKRIISCMDVDTGEIITDLGSHLMAAYTKLPRYTLDRLCEENYEVLQVLLYVAKADGSLRAAERKVIVAACKVFTHDPRLTDDMVNKTLNNIDVPSLRTFKVAVGKVHKRGDQSIMRKLIKASQTIVNTQKTVTATEQEALDYMAKRFEMQL